MKRILILMLLPLFVGTGIAQTSVWKVSKDGNDMYLAGSVHLLKESDYPLPQEFDKAFENSEKLVFEADIDKMNDPQLAQQIMMKAMLEDDKTLKNVLSEEVYKTLEAEAGKMSIPLANLARLKPSMVILTMTQFKLQQMGITAKGVDQFYHNKAKEANKGLGHLETIEEQLDVLVNMGEGNEDEFVKYSINDMESMGTMLDELINTWRDGSSSVMKKQLTEMKEEYPETYEAIMVKRNNNWMPQLEEYMTDDVIEFVIVGALHLHGTDGLLEMLEAKGYTIEQL